ncbi:tRNA U34 5-methylaminomethyl-2-thiouridine-forming methyltransferase MnmC [Maribacter vaceletii]|uniref:tRNA U34 5-methylaminomethyl-2-thiouridine-forming methyltransferase MnmC n=1 Tax=Maribacter vaceletii TaxID=1206816 RepID=A0A495E6N5_9FLAO|nr:tRNA (5-methylaminomethyl-2-thiouridine)(34)-methyltransferase MnmD [Maribacter vaceletii]RKR12341.1 tRNA U34 5-methylaminomethyl-2-thiouridine-forming methyltransferase MnmC [Maribacter vaceletii]
MKREIIITADGSKTIHIPDWNEQYHSKHGAIQEAYHVFIKNGLSLFSENEISILEIGFGTGLNALITSIESKKTNLKVNYTGIEAYPVSLEELNSLNYLEELNAENQKHIFNKMHSSEWGVTNQISDDFSLLKEQKNFLDIKNKEDFNLIYFDAFGARVQPELWTEEIFKIMYDSLKEDGYLVTYSAKGSVRRAMQSVGFVVERLPGPPGKREMLRAQKKL